MRSVERRLRLHRWPFNFAFRAYYGFGDGGGGVVYGETRGKCTYVSRRDARLYGSD